MAIFVIPSDIILFIVSSFIPASDNISFECSPNKGWCLRISVLVSEKLIGNDGVRNFPSVG